MGRAERTGPDPEEKAQGPLGSGHRWGWGTFSLATGTDRGGPGAAPEERPLGATSSRCWKWPGTLGPDERSSLRPSPDPPSGFHQPVCTHAWDIQGAVEGAARLHPWSGDNGDTWRGPYSHWEPSHPGLLCSSATRPTVPRTLPHPQLRSLLMSVCWGCLVQIHRCQR